MANSSTLVAGIKARLRLQGMSYAQLARALEVSEPTIKRDLARGNFTLERLDAMCRVLGVGLDELLVATGPTALTELSEAQERALVADPKLVLVTYLSINDWKFEEIVDTYQLDANELVSILLKLDKLGIVDFRPPTRIRKLTARNFGWRRDGPVHSYFLRKVVPDFFQSQFKGPADTLHFLAGMLSTASLLRLQASLQNVAAEFDQLARADTRLPFDDRHGAAVMLGLRPWEFSEFRQLRRGKARK
jgi:transcriptional regulator with XRE-family HTH domain